MSTPIAPPAASSTPSSLLSVTAVGASVAPVEMSSGDFTQSLLPAANQHTTFASRNPLKDVIPLIPREDRSVARTDGDALLRRQVKKEASELFDAAIEEFLQQQKTAMELLAKEHSVAYTVVQQRCTYGLVYKKARRANLANAITHAKSKEYNKDLPKGERLRLTDILKKVKEEPNTDLTEEEKTELINNLERHRLTRKSGARASNKAAGMDAVSTVARLQQEFSHFHERTGMHALAIIARGHVDDPNIIEVCETPGALDFIPNILHFTVQDVVRMFDNYTSSTGVLGPLTEDKRPALRAELSKTIATGLQIALNNKRVKMNYASYQTAIVEKHRVRIVGWPENLPIIAPSDMSSVYDLRPLLSLWRTGACRWNLMRADDVAKHTAELEAKAAAGEVAKKRKERSDKGTTRKRKEPDVNDDVGSSKRRKTTAMQTAAQKKGRGGGKGGKENVGRSKATQAAAKMKKTLPPKSKRFVVSDDEDDDDDYEGNGAADEEEEGEDIHMSGGDATLSGKGPAADDDEEDELDPY